MIKKVALLGMLLCVGASYGAELSLATYSGNPIRELLYAALPSRPNGDDELLQGGDTVDHRLEEREGASACGDACLQRSLGYVGKLSARQLSMLTVAIKAEEDLRRSLLQKCAERGLLKQVDVSGSLVYAESLAQLKLEEMRREAASEARYKETLKFCEEVREELEEMERRLEESEDSDDEIIRNAREMLARQLRLSEEDRREDERREKEFAKFLRELEEREQEWRKKHMRRYSTSW